MSNNDESSVNLVDPNAVESSQDLINLINQLSLTNQSGNQSSVASQSDLINLINQLSLTSQSVHPNSDEVQQDPINISLTSHLLPNGTNNLDTHSTPPPPPQQQQQPAIALNINSAFTKLIETIKDSITFPKQLQVMEYQVRY